jgi:peptide/nickel transport system substrate-binding protein
MVARAATPETAPGAMAVYSGTDYLDPDNFLYASYHSSQAGTWSAASHYNNPEVDALLDAGRSSVDQEERIGIYNQIQQKLVADAVEMWVYTDVGLVAWDPGLTGTVLGQVMGGDLREFGWGTTA